MTKVTDAPLSLETRLSRLETIVAVLEREDLELDEALRLYEEGIGHLRSAQETLRQAELRIERLVEAADGAMIVEGMGQGGE